ncbi:RNA-binding S4 domain-containing protein [Alicyclobacillus acidiphilus]|uniref:RNA-binding S4 domain-containing protein n=1 Tax=Alicyclobacillus acidiphilus TaxID=182455 RepID=UPI00082FB6E9|nr:RNA-binding S4 domain-containing protein [Alicyclobacillus acidiphilus]
MDIEFDGPFITVGQLLKKLNIVSSGGEVKVFLEEHGVSVNRQAENRRGRKLVDGDIVRIGKQEYRLRRSSHAAP